jgi:hypothetical protein
MCGAKMKALTIPNSEMAKGRLAQPRRLFKDRIEHRGEVAGRGIDDPQHLGGRGLLLQSLVMLNSTFVEAPLKLNIRTFEISNDLVRIA